MPMNYNPYLDSAKIELHFIHDTVGSFCNVVASNIKYRGYRDLQFYLEYVSMCQMLRMIEGNAKSEVTQRVSP
jgi:hypothetical protein